MITEEMMKIKEDMLGNGVGDTNGLSWSINYGNVVAGVEFAISNKDKEILKKYASIVAQLAEKPEQKSKIALWEKHHALERTKPLIFCDPENAWYELIPNNELECSGNLARVWEFKLKKEIYWTQNIQDDRVVENTFSVHYIYRKTGRGFDLKQTGGEHGGAYSWATVLENYEDIDAMKPSRVVVDFDRTQKLVQTAKDVFDGILTVKLEGIWWWSLGMTTDLVFLRGFEKALFDFYDNPKGVHRLMAFLRDENLQMLRFLEENNLLTLNNGGDFVGTGGYGWSDELPQKDFDGKSIRTKDMWGFCESQETSGVSPEIFEEFIFPYQLDILKAFGLNIYGCCEALDKRWDIIKKIPKLRKVTVSPWSDDEAMAEHLGGNYVFSKKVNPANIAGETPNEEVVRQELRRTFDAAKKHDCRVQVLMRDIMTVSFNPNNISRWVQIAREEADKV